MMQFAGEAAATFDYVVIGGGSAGSVLAHHLSADPVRTVAVIEAGPWDTHPYIHVPAGFVKLNTHPELTWSFESEPTEQTAGRRIRLPQGKVVGGSSSINGMIYNRGQREDFDHWRDLGNPGWSYEEVLPYFRRGERRIGAGDPAFRGRDGLLPVTDHDWRDPVSEAFLEGLAQAGIPRNPDYNGPSQEGCAYFQRAIEGGRRVSAARAFLHTARGRRNLEVLTRTHVTRILVREGRAVGVEVVDAAHSGPPRTLLARREVILSAGALNTPRILQLSGIGPGERLSALGIPVRHDLPGVGEGLRDHYAVRIVAAAKDVLTINEHARGWRLARQVFNWALGRPSVLAIAPSLVYASTRSPYSPQRPDLQFIFTPGSYRVGKVYVLDRYPGMIAGFAQQRPESRGHVRIASADPFEKPLVQPNYLHAEHDRKVVVAALRMTREFMQSRAMQRYFDRETLPGPQAQSDEHLLQYAREHGITSFHYVSTARMGPGDDRMAVVDPELRVHGLQGLRVVDASIMPMIPSANTYAATLMIAEKAADLILGRSAAPAADPRVLQDDLRSPQTFATDDASR